MVQSWISIKTVLASISSTINPTYFREADIIEWSAEAAAKIDMHTQYEMDVKYLQVQDYRVCLPKGLIQIEMVAYKHDFTLDDEDLEQDLLDETGASNFDDGGAQHLTRFNSPWFANNFSPLRLSTSPFALGVHCDNCVNIDANCEHTYTVNPNGTITTSFQNGFICISYLRNPLDEEGYPIIPNNADYIDALTTYCLLKLWERRWNENDPNADSKMKWYSAKWTVLRNSATGAINLPSIDQLENIRQTRNRLIPKERRYYSFFGNMATEESLGLGGTHRQ